MIKLKKTLKKGVSLKNKLRDNKNKKIKSDVKTRFA